MDKELPNAHGVLLDMYDERAFSRDAIREFPELAAELKAEENLLHVQVAVLGRAAQEEIVGNTLHLAPKIFAFLERALTQPRAISEITQTRLRFPLLNLLDWLALSGGGSLFSSLLQLGLVDAVEVAIIPVLLGAGVPLLPYPATTATLRLRKHRIYEKTGTVALEYSLA